MQLAHSTSVAAITTTGHNWGCAVVREDANYPWKMSVIQKRIITLISFFLGLSSEEKLHGVKYIIESFVGCISDMVLSSGKAASDLLPIVPLIATKHENVKEGCIDKCWTMENLCFEGSRCINEYNGYRCDCFGTLYEEQLCDVFSKYFYCFLSIWYFL